MTTAIIEAMAEGPRAGDGGNHLITFHPRGLGISSDYFHKADCLDFNMVQSSHAAHDHDNGLYIEHDYALTPPKPTLDGEPRYEAIRVGFYLNEQQGIYFRRTYQLWLRGSWHAGRGRFFRSRLLTTR